MLHLGPVLLGETPRLVVCLRDQTPEDAWRAFHQARVDILEFRVDQFQSTDAEYVCRTLERAAGWPVLATIRFGGEGGAWTSTEAARLALFEAVMPIAHAVDIELAAKDILARVVDAARDLSRLIVMSHHDFEHTPPLESIHALCHGAREAGAHVFKIAALCQSREDLCTLARFTLDAPMPVVVIGMGTFGAASRIFFPALGSLFSYAAFGAETAPGQWGYEEMSVWFDRLYPNPGKK